MFRSCQIIIRELSFLLKLYYNIHNSIDICKRGVVAAYHVVWECVVEQWLGVRLRRTSSFLLQSSISFGLFTIQGFKKMSKRVPLSPA